MYYFTLGRNEGRCNLFNPLGKEKTKTVLPSTPGRVSLLLLEGNAVGRRHRSPTTPLVKENAQQLLRRMSARPVHLSPPSLHALALGGQRPGLAAGGVLVVGCSPTPVHTSCAQRWLCRVVARHLAAGGHVTAISTPASRGLSRRALAEVTHPPLAPDELNARLRLLRLNDWQELEALCGTAAAPLTRTEENGVPLVVVQLHTAYLQQLERFTGLQIPVPAALLRLQCRLQAALIIVEQAASGEPNRKRPRSHCAAADSFAVASDFLDRLCARGRDGGVAGLRLWYLLLDVAVPPKASLKPNGNGGWSATASAAGTGFELVLEDPAPAGTLIDFRYYVSRIRFHFLFFGWRREGGISAEEKQNKQQQQPELMFRAWYGGLQPSAFSPPDRASSFIPGGALAFPASEDALYIFLLVFWLAGESVGSAPEEVESGQGERARKHRDKEKKDRKDRKDRKEKKKEKKEKRRSREDVEEEDSAGLIFLTTDEANASLPVDAPQKKRRRAEGAAPAKKSKGVDTALLESAAQQLLAAMRAAAEADAAAASNPTQHGPPLHRIAIRSAVESLCAKRVYQPYLLDGKVLELLCDWLLNPGTHCLAPLELRTTALDILLRFPTADPEKDTSGLSRDNLLDTNLGRAVNTLRLNADETPENRAKCSVLLERFNRAISESAGSRGRAGAVGWKCMGQTDVAPPFETVQTPSEAFQKNFMRPDPRDPTSYHNLLRPREPVQIVTNLSGSLHKRFHARAPPGGRITDLEGLWGATLNFHITHVSNSFLLHSCGIRLKDNCFYTPVLCRGLKGTGLCPIIAPSVDIIFLASSSAVQMSWMADVWYSREQQPAARHELRPLHVVGEGSFGVVVSAAVVGTKERVAIKRVRCDPRVASRELAVLRDIIQRGDVRLRVESVDAHGLCVCWEGGPSPLQAHGAAAPLTGHPNIVRLHTYYYSDELGPDGSQARYLHLVMSYLPNDLRRLKANFFSPQAPGGAQTPPRQASAAAPGENDRSAKIIRPGESSRNTSYICSRFYRAPELLFGSMEYGSAIDVWSLGCLMAELIRPGGKPLFRGHTTVDQMAEIFKVLGTPSTADMMAMNPVCAAAMQRCGSDHRDLYSPRIAGGVAHIRPQSWEQALGEDEPLPAATRDLLSRMLRYRPEERPTAVEVLNHAFFDDLLHPDGPALPPHLLNLTPVEHAILPLSLQEKMQTARSAHLGRRAAHQPPSPLPRSVPCSLASFFPFIFIIFCFVGALTRGLSASAAMDRHDDGSGCRFIPLCKKKPKQTNNKLTMTTSAMRLLCFTLSTHRTHCCSSSSNPLIPPPGSAVASVRIMPTAPHFFFPSSSVLASATRHALMNVLRIPKEHIGEGADFGVCVDSVRYNGIGPLVRVLRRRAVTPEDHQFLGGTSFEQAFVVNQWLSAAAWLSFDAEHQAQGSQAGVLYARVEQMLESQQLSQSFLGLTPAPSVADLLLFVALQRHPLSKEMLPATQRWVQHVQSHPMLEPFRSAQPAQTGADASAGKGKTKPVYVKPSEEAIQQRRLEKEKAKKEKEALKAAAGDGSAAKRQSQAPVPKPAAVVSLNDQIDIRVGRITNLRRHPEADRLYIEDMDIGTEVRTVVSGLVEHYTPEQLEQRLCFVFCNMKPRPLKGVVSQGMVLCAHGETKVVLARPPEGAQPGDRVVFGDAYAAPTNAPPEPLSASKMTDLLQHFCTDSDGVVCWKDQKAWLAQGSVAIPDMKNCAVK
eukprot:gene10227-7168_t